MFVIWCFFLCCTWVWTGSAPLRVRSVWAHCSRLTRCCSPQTSGGQTRLSGVWRRRRERRVENWMSQDLLSSVLFFNLLRHFHTIRHRWQWVLFLNCCYFSVSSLFERPIKTKNIDQKQGNTLSLLKTHSQKLRNVVGRTLLNPAQRRGRTDGSSWSAGLRRQTQTYILSAKLQQIYMFLWWCQVFPQTNKDSETFKSETVILLIGVTG